MTTSNLYPFVSKSSIKARLTNEPAFRLAAMVCLYDMQTAHEQDTKSTLNKNRVGFMSSHAVKGSTVAVKIKAGEPLSAEDLVTVDTIAPRYSRQIALHFRAQAIAADPSLAATAALFSADKNLPATPAPEASVEEIEEVEADADSTDQLDV
jgi:hypothetical protein